jgi:hypothetical protein
MPCTGTSTKAFWPRLWHETERQQDVSGRQTTGSSMTRWVRRAWLGHDGHAEVVGGHDVGQTYVTSYRGGHRCMTKPIVATFHRLNVLFPCDPSPWPIKGLGPTTSPHVNSHTYLSSLKLCTTTLPRAIQAK